MLGQSELCNIKPVFCRGQEGRELLIGVPASLDLTEPTGFTITLSFFEFINTSSMKGSVIIPTSPIAQQQNGQEAKTTLRVDSEG